MNSYQYLVPRKRMSQSSSFEPFRSVLHSKALTELQLSKPTHLISDSNTSLEVSYLDFSRTLENPFLNYSSASMYASRASPKTTRENPFIKATPFRYSRKEPTREAVKGLSNWEKQKYIQMYAQEAQEEWPQSSQPRRTDPPRQSYQQGKERMNQSKKVSSTRNPRAQPPLPEPQTASFKKRLSKQYEEEETPLPYFKSGIMNLKTKFSQRQDPPKEPERYWNYEKDQFARLNQNQSNEDKEGGSLINKLQPKQLERKHSNMTNSRVYEYQYGNPQTNYQPIELTELQKGEMPRITPTKSEDRFNFDDPEEPRRDTFYINRIRQFPTSFMYRYSKFEMIKLT